MGNNAAGLYALTEEHDAIREAVREISRLPERERGLVLGIVRQFGDQGHGR